MNPNLSNPAKRLEAYCAKGKMLFESAFSLDFDADVWQLPSKRAAGKANHRLDFSSFEEPFKGLLKAVVANETAPRCGMGSFGHHKVILAARYLAAVVAGVEDLTSLSTDDFHRAIDSLRNRDDLSDSTKWGMAGQLTRLANVLTSNRLTNVRIKFQNPCHQDLTACDKHLIPQGAIKAFGTIWQEVMKGTDNDQDRLLVCTSTLLLCTGFRINELLSMPVDCWHNGRGRDSQGRILEGVWLGYAPEKNGLTEGTLPKWIPSDLTPLVRECVAEIKRITQPFRENARALFEGRVNLPSMDEERTYNAVEVAKILGLSPASISSIWRSFETYTMAPRKGRGGKDYIISPKEIQALVRSRSFHGKVMTEPWSQELHESLFVISYGFFNRTANGMNGTATPLIRDTVYFYLAGHPGGNNLSCFERFNQKNPETGQFWRFATHDPRHTLTTWMKRAGLSELEIAAFFGRNTRDPVAANENYDHLQPGEMLEIVRQALERGAFIGPWADILKSVKDPIRRSELKNTMLGNISYSKLGLCAHAEGTTPPTMPEACARCPGVIVVKGNPRHLQETQEQLTECEKTIAHYERQMAEGYINKNRWLDVEMERREGLVRMLEIHLDPNIPNRTLVQLSPYRQRAKV